MWQHDGKLAVARLRAIAADRGFLEEAHLAALGPIALVGYGWTKERLRAQFHAEVELANCELITVDGRRAGYLSMLDRVSHWYIDAFAIMPNYQRRGVGGAVLRDVLAEAGRTPVRLNVLRTNRARHLYLRLGFRAIAGDARRELMEWRAAT